MVLLTADPAHAGQGANRTTFAFSLPKEDWPAGVEKELKYTAREVAQAAGPEEARRMLDRYPVRVVNAGGKALDETVALFGIR